MATVKKETPSANIQTVVIDLASLASVRTGAAEINALGEPIHVGRFPPSPYTFIMTSLRQVLIANAAISPDPTTLPEAPGGSILRTADGFEAQFGANHLAHFLLTILVVPRLKQAAAGTPSFSPRVVATSSEVQSFGPLRFDDPNFTVRPAEYTRMGAYIQSKLANVLFIREVAKRLGPDGILAYSVHPGSVYCHFVREGLACQR